MFIARFVFKPGGVADQFVPVAGQTVVEMLWDDMLELIAFIQEVEDIVEDCIVLTRDGIIHLKGQESSSASA